MGILQFEGSNVILKYSSYITCVGTPGKDEKVTIYFRKAPDENKIEYPCATFNMQKDYACFESIAFSIWSEYPKCHINLKYDPYVWNGEISGLKDDENARNPRLLNYMRFLYRAWKMKSLYSTRFFIDDMNVKEVENFGIQYESALKNDNLVYSGPTKETSVSYKSKLENLIEKYFVLTGIKEESIVSQKEFILRIIVLHDQLPCSIFYENEKTRLFSDGYIDLWGVDEINKQICIFELKEDGNTKLGIISELFFYSCILKDIVEIGKDYKESTFRGVQKLWGKKCWTISALFLVPSFYSFLEEDNRIDRIIDEMNNTADEIIKYGYIKYDQKKMVEDEQRFREDVSKKWKILSKNRRQE